MSTIKAGKVGEQLQASFTMTASADLEKRTISGILVPFGELGFGSWGPTVFDSGSVSIGDNVVMLMDHDVTRPVGRLVEATTTDAGIHGTFKIASTPAGDTVLLEASEGLRTGLSVGVQVEKYLIDENSDAIHIVDSTLRETSSVVFPAFDSARVDKVAASEPITPASDADHGADVPQGETMETTDPATHAVPDVPQPVIVGREAFPYRRGVEHSFFRDQFHAKNDEAAAARFHQAVKMLEAAAVSADVAEVIPETYRPDMYVEQLRTTRLIGEGFGIMPLYGPNPFRLPKFGTSTGLNEDHVEGTNPTPGAITFDEQLVTPVSKSGSYLCSREMLEGSTPGLDSIIMTAMYEDYDLDSEAYWRTIVLAGATVGTVVDISNGATMDVRKRMIDFSLARKRAASLFFAGEDLFTALATQVDGAGRPMNPEIGATNASGSTSNDVMTVTISGKVTPLVPVLTGGLLAVKSDVALYESGLRSWKWEEVEGPANVKFSTFGYIAGAVLRASGVLKFATQA